LEKTKVDAPRLDRRAMCAPDSSAGRETDFSHDAASAPLIMSQLSIRLNPDNPNHHLWNNNGTWFIHYVVHPTPITKDRIRRSLGTKSLAEARARRDAILGAPLQMAA
jgi:hypothetical protein